MLMKGVYIFPHVLTRTHTHSYIIYVYTLHVIYTTHTDIHTFPAGEWLCAVLHLLLFVLR